MGPTLSRDEAPALALMVGGTQPGAAWLRRRRARVGALLILLLYLGLLIATRRPTTEPVTSRCAPPNPWSNAVSGPGALGALGVLQTDGGSQLIAGGVEFGAAVDVRRVRHQDRQALRNGVELVLGGLVVASLGVL
jgi:hypothetical protein